MSYYASILLTYFFIDVIAALGLDIQVGLTGILNFGFILFQAAGAYTVAVTTLGSPSKWLNTQIYFGGWSLPFPLPLILAALWYGLRSRFQFHRRIARWTFPVWLYVSVTGVIVYFFLKAYTG